MMGLEEFKKAAEEWEKEMTELKKAMEELKKVEAEAEAEGMSMPTDFLGKIYRSPSPANSVSTSSNSDTSLAKLDAKKLSLIKAWKENEKAIAENNAVKMMSTISAWENSKKAEIEADLKNVDALKNMKAGYAEKQKNKIVEIHKEAKEKRAIVAAKRGEDLLKVEEMAAKYCASGFSLKNLWWCF